MPCFSPLQAYKPAGGGSLEFAERPGSQPVEISCGQCIGCRLERARQWAMRCVHESQMHEFSEFVTLTYDDEHLPVDHSLRYSDFQLFMKRLRVAYSRRQRKLYADKELRRGVSSATDYERCPAKRIRFYMCGEYGDLTGRPHFHACLFGLHLHDRVLFKRTGSGENIYTSEFLSEAWKFGHCSTGNVTFESAAYIARYVLKKRFGDVANEHSHYRYVDDYGEVHYREPEFNHMSLKPGIGGSWFEKYESDVYPSDEVIINGRPMKPPKYYDKLLARRNADMAEYLPYEREAAIAAHLDDCTSARLLVREEVTRACLRSKLRSLE